MAQVRIFSHTPTWVGMAAQIDQIGGPYQPMQGLRINRASDSLRRRRADGFSRGVYPLPSIEVIVILECVSSATKALTRPPLPNFAQCPCSGLRMVNMWLYNFTILSALISNVNVLTAMFTPLVDVIIPMPSCRPGMMIRVNMRRKRPVSDHLSVRDYSPAELL